MISRLKHFKYRSLIFYYNAVHMWNSMTFFKACNEKYSQVFEIWEMFKGFWVNVGQNLCITYLSGDKTEKNSLH